MSILTRDNFLRTEYFSVYCNLHLKRVKILIMKDSDPTKKPNYPIESVDNALKLLLLFGEQNTISLTEASRLIGVVPSTAHRLLSMLQYRGFVRQDPVSRLYVAGSALVGVGLSVVRKMDIRDQARPFMEKLSIEVGETVHLSILQERDILFLKTVEGPKVLRVADRTGVSLPAHCTAAGKAMLAEVSVERLHELFPKEQLPPGLLPRSLVYRTDLERELDQVRQRGYATNYEESEPGLSAVAAVIRDHRHQVRAALGVTAPVSRLDEERVSSIAEATMRTAAEIGQHLAL